MIGSPRRPRAWYQAWLFALAHPRADGFAALLRDPTVGINRALGWMAAAFAASMVIILLEVRALRATAVLCYTPSVVLAGLAGFTAYAGITHQIMRLARGKGLYRDLAYLYAAYHAPLLMISAALLPIPVLRWAALGLALLALVLNVFAIRTAHRVGWPTALVGGLWPAAFVLVMLALILAAGSVAIRL